MQDAAHLARAHTETAIAALAEVMNSECSEPREVIAAANAILDRAHGKPSQAVIMVPAAGSGDMGRKLAAMSDAELLAALGELRMKQRAALPAIEAEVVDGDDGGAPQEFDVPPPGSKDRWGKDNPLHGRRFEVVRALIRAERDGEPPPVAASADDFDAADPLSL